MRSRTFVLAIIGLCLISMTPPAYGEIAGSEHDFSGRGWSQGRICTVCHTPHRADSSVTGAPLWNHEVSVATYTLYSSPTLDATVNQPTGASKLCLSCHDGTVALDSFGGNQGGEMIGGDALIGTDLRGSHPISLAYDSNLAATDGRLHDPTATSSGLGGTISEDLLFDSNLECASCHDVHSSANNEGLLRINNAGSALCLICHDI